METVYRAQAYRFGAMGSLGDATYMLIRQYQFPHQYDPNQDKMVGWDHDRIMQQQHDHGRRCFTEHMGTGELGLESWVRRTAPDKVIAFLRDILQADQNVSWTGFRVLGTVHRGNGYPVWTLQLFAKHPNTRTKVFSTENAPNVIGVSHYAHRLD